MLTFDRFSLDAQECASGAYGILQRYGNSQVDTEHLLLAMLERPGGLGGQMPATASLDQELMKKRLDDVLRALPKTPALTMPAGQVFISPRVKEVLEQADADASQQPGTLISSEHILRAILAERDTDVARILGEAGLSQG
jgi:ATP-dependent Clp protease ATP-binding subunit ClpC